MRGRHQFANGYVSCHLSPEKCLLVTVPDEALGGNSSLYHAPLHIRVSGKSDWRPYSPISVSQINWQKARPDLGIPATWGRGRIKGFRYVAARRICPSLGYRKKVTHVVNPPPNVGKERAFLRQGSSEDQAFTTRISPKPTNFLIPFHYKK